MRLFGYAFAVLLLLIFPYTDTPYLVVLGVAQDGGYPQAGDRQSPAWDDPRLQRLPVSLGLVDPGSHQRWLFEATPAFKQQLRRLDQVAPVTAIPGLDGIFLTHAHVGHYAGLIHLGFEIMGTSQVPVYAMPRMITFLRNNGPWDQLIRYRNIEPRALSPGVPVALNERLSITAFPVPHRQEYSEVVGYRIQGPTRSVLFIPDIDSWKEWDEQGVHIEHQISQVDVAYIDGSFFADGEVAGRDMSGFPHPRISETMDRLSILPAKEKNKVRFIHLNNSNPALDPSSTESKMIRDRGFRVAQELEKVSLGG